MELINRIFFADSKSFQQSPQKNLDLFAILFLIICFIGLELMMPFYFTKDDNLLQFLPVMLDFYRKLETGIFSTYNPYQYLGFSPISTGVYALAYPITCFSYFFAKYVLGNAYALIEVFAIIHITAGYFMMNRLMRLCSISPAISFLGSLCFVLSGYTLLVGRCWYYMLPLVFWTPAIIYSYIHLLEKQNSKWILITGCMLGFSFYSGNAQMWIYTLILMGTIALIYLMTKKANLKKLLSLISSFFVAMTIVAPLFVLQYTLTEKMPKDVWGDGIADGILSMIFPHPIIQTNYPNGWGYLLKHLGGQLYYSGTLFSLVAFISLILFLYALATIKRNRIGELLYSNIWLICGYVAFIFALGKYGLIWTLLENTHPFDRFSNPFKFLHFINLFFILSSGLVLTRFLQCTKVKSDVLEKILIFSVLPLLMYHLSLCKVSHSPNIFKPYADLNPGIKSHLSAEARIFSYFTKPPEFISNYEQTLPNNIPSVHQIPSLEGIDNITYRYHRTSTFVTLDRSPRILNYYGIKHLLIYGPYDESIVHKDFSPIYSEDDWHFLEAKQFLPLAFNLSDVSPYKINYTGTGIDINIDRVLAGERVVINFAHYPQFEATINEEVVPIAWDLLGRMVIQIKTPGHLLKLRYKLDYLSGLVMAIICSFLAFVFYKLSFLKRFSETSNFQQS